MTNLMTDKFDGFVDNDKFDGFVNNDKFDKFYELNNVYNFVKYDKDNVTNLTTVINLTVLLLN